MEKATRTNLMAHLQRAEALLEDVQKELNNYKKSFDTWRTLVNQTEEEDLTLEVEGSDDRAAAVLDLQGPHADVVEALESLDSEMALVRRLEGWA